MRPPRTVTATVLADGESVHQTTVRVKDHALLGILWPGVKLRLRGPGTTGLRNGEAVVWSVVGNEITFATRGGAKRKLSWFIKDAEDDDQIERAALMVVERNLLADEWFAGRGRV